MLGTEKTFERCARWLLERPGCGWLVVHGFVHGRGYLKGERYAHAWLEQPLSDMALDMTTDTPIIVSAEQYRQIANPEIIETLDITAIQDRVTKHHSYGPWNSALAGTKTRTVH